MNPPNEESPPAVAATSEPSNFDPTPDSLHDVARAVNSPTVIASASNIYGGLTPEQAAEVDVAAFFSATAPSEPAGLAAEPQILWRRDYPNGTSIVRLPTHARDSDAFHEILIRWHNGTPDERVVATLKKLWMRGRLPLFVLVVFVHPGELAFGLDAPCPERLDKFQADLEAISWLVPPWKTLRAFAFSSDAVNDADEAGLGMRYPAGMPS